MKRDHPGFDGLVVGPTNRAFQLIPVQCQLEIDSAGAMRVIGGLRDLKGHNGPIHLAFFERVLLRLAGPGASGKTVPIHIQNHVEWMRTLGALCARPRIVRS